MKRFLIVLLVLVMPSIVFAQTINDDIARGLKSTNYETVYINAVNDTVSTSLEGINDYSAAFNFLSTASTLKVTSISSDDITAGVGLRTLRVYGLKSDYTAVTEDFVMNGQTEVTGAVSFIRVNKVEGLTYGANSTNSGEVYVFTGTSTAGVPDSSTTILGKILIGNNVTLQANYTIPVANMAIIKKISLSGKTIIDAFSGSGTFGSTTGTTITIGATMPSATYRVSVVPTFTPDGTVGDIGVTDKTTSNFKVTNSGANSTASFDWILMPDGAPIASGLEFKIFKRTFGGAWENIFTKKIRDMDSVYEFSYPLLIPAKCDIKIDVVGGSGLEKAAAQIELLLIK